MGCASSKSAGGAALGPSRPSTVGKGEGGDAAGIILQPKPPLSPLSDTSPHTAKTVPSPGAATADRRSTREGEGAEKGRGLFADTKKGEGVHSDPNAPRIGQLTRGGRRNSAEVREAPALPLASTSKLIQAGPTDPSDGRAASPAGTGVGGRRGSTLARLTVRGPGRLQEGWKQIHAAVESGSVEAVAAELKCMEVKKETDPKLTRVNAKTADTHGYTPLLLAARGGRVAIINLLLTHGARVGVADNSGFTPLHAAAQAGHTDVASILIDAGADLEAGTYTAGEEGGEGGKTPLLCAVESGQAEMVELLLENLAQLGGGLLSAAAAQGDEEVLEVLLMFKSSLELDEKDDKGRSPLHLAAERGHLGATKQLLQKGATIDLEASDGSTPLGAACFNGHSSVVQLLLSRGAKVDNRDGGQDPGGEDAGGGGLGDTFSEDVREEGQREIKALLQVRR